MKKVLILTVTAGNGHNSCANAMKNRLEAGGGFEVKIVDVIKEYTSKINSWTIDKGYNIACGYLLPFYNMGYNRYMKSDPKKAKICGAQKWVKDASEGVLKLIYDFQPDVIFGTAYYAGIILANLRRCFAIPAKTISCMLDYVISPFWEACVGGIDVMTISNEAFRQGMIEKGFSNENLVCTGIPVDSRFLQKISRSEACEKLGLDEKIFTIFVFYGGGHWHGGYKIFKIIAKNFKKKVQVVVVNGHDKQSKEKIDRDIKKLPKNIIVKNFGFSKEIPLIMSACDVMIGKGGGLSTTESVLKELPLIATKKLPMQEVWNIRFLESVGVALSFGNKKELISHLNDLYDNPDKLKDMKEKLKPLKTNGLEEIFKIISTSPKISYENIDKNIDWKKVNKMVSKARKN